MFSLFAGPKYAKEISRELGVREALFSSALLEVGMTWAAAKWLRESGMSNREAIEVLLPKFEDGLEILTRKFGPQEEILNAHAAVERWRIAHSISDEL